MEKNQEVNSSSKCNSLGFKKDLKIIGCDWSSITKHGFQQHTFENTQLTNPNTQQNPPHLQTPPDGYFHADKHAQALQP
jgi:hypothetical protein